MNEQNDAATVVTGECCQALIAVLFWLQILHLLVPDVSINI